MVRRLAWLALVVIALGVAPARAELPVADARLELILDPRDTPPREKEMVLATLRGVYDVPITLHEVVIPRMPDFDWVQLTRDAWSTERIGGRQLQVMERRIAFFPRRSGELTIRPIDHELSVAEPTGGWTEHVVKSPPVTISVEPRLGEEGTWWLPAKMVELSDKWNKGPGELRPGETAVRRVTLWVLGATVEMLPPQPEIREPWLITFVSPEERTTELTWGGPISTVTWEWTFQPITGEPGVIPPVELPFFDTLERSMEKVTLPATPIAVVGFGENISQRWRNGFDGTWLVLLAGIAGCAVALGVALPGLRLATAHELKRTARRVLPDPALWAMGHGARTGDTATFRKAAVVFVDRHAGVDAAERARLLEPLDRQLFGAGEEPPTAADLLAARAELRAAVSKIEQTRHA